MSKIELPEPEEGDEISAALFRDLIRAVKQLQAGPIVSGGLVNTGDGNLSFAGQFVALAQSGASPIPARSGGAMGTGNAILWACSGRTLSAGQTVPVYNPHPTQQVPANRLLYLGKFAGLWIVLGWHCP